MSRMALRRGVAPESIALLAEAVFDFVEELSSASARGYVDEQLATAPEPYPKRATASSPENSCLPDLKNFHQTNAPPVPTSTIRAITTIAVHRFQRDRAAIKCPQKVLRYSTIASFCSAESSVP